MQAPARTDSPLTLARIGGFAAVNDYDILTGANFPSRWRP